MRRMWVSTAVTFGLALVLPGCENGSSTGGGGGMKNWFHKDKKDSQAMTCKCKVCGMTIQCSDMMAECSSCKKMVKCGELTMKCPACGKSIMCCDAGAEAKCACGKKVKCETKCPGCGKMNTMKCTCMCEQCAMKKKAA